MEAAEGLSREVGVAPACRALSLSRATLYRRRNASSKPAPPAVRPTPARALSPEERHMALNVLNSERFCDMAPAAAYAVLLDEGVYICSARTMYRILADAGEVKERRNQLRHPNYAKPELLATAPNQVWSWDITKLKGCAFSPIWTPNCMNADTPERSDAGTPYVINNCPAWCPKTAFFNELTTSFSTISGTRCHFLPEPSSPKERREP